MTERPHAGLEQLGFSEELRATFAAHGECGLAPARVARVDGRAVLVFCEGGTATAHVPSRIARQTPPVVGDWVALAPGGDALPPTVAAVLPRTSQFVRRDPGRATRPQVLAANMDAVFVTHAASDEPNLNRIERELAAVWESGAVPVLVLTKADLVEDAESAGAAVARVASGVEVLVTSAVTGLGIDAVAAHAEHGRTIAMLGPSGVGKSTLINRIVGEDVMPVGEIRESDGKGRHITVTRELVPLPGGGAIIDTPGLRAVGLWDADQGLEQAFPEIAELADACRFRDCRHAGEPGCAVEQAAASGALDPRRLESYRRLADELHHLAEAQDVRARLEKKRQDKALGRTIKRYHKDHPR